MLEAPAAYDQWADQIVLDAGVPGWFSTGVLFNNQLRTVVWSWEEGSCRDTISQVYLGLTKVHEYTGGKKDNNVILLGNSIMVLDNDVGSKDRSEDARYVGLVL